MSDPSNEPASEQVDTKKGGVLTWMAKNAVAANLLMIALLVGGYLTLKTSIKQEIFPEFELDFVVVNVIYPGASPAEVEKGVILAGEEAIREVEGVKRVRSTALEGSGTIVVELRSGTDADRALADVKAAIDRVTSFPEDIERPVVSLAQNRFEVISLVLYGDVDDKVLRRQAERVRDDLLADDGITVVSLFGVRNPEISIDVPQEELRRHGLTLEGIAGLVRANSVEVPGGGVKTPSGEVLMRTNERKLEGDEFEDLVVVSRPDGTEVRLGDIANVRDDFEEIDRKAYYNGKRAVMVKVYRVGDQTPVSISDKVQEYLRVNQASLAPGVKMDVWGDFSEFYRDRLALLQRNAVMGLILVIIVLGLFLEIRLAFWVTLGIPISFVGSLIFLPAANASINMISLFAFIVSLGIVVDDAIVVGEAIYKKRQDGLKGLQAAVAGVREVAVPISFAILTTIFAFAPMLFVPGPSGKFFRLLPIVVIAVLCISWIESLFILPAHLAHSGTSQKGVWGWINRQQGKVGGWLDWWVQKTYVPTLKAAVRRKFLTLAICVSTLIAAVGLVAGKRVAFIFIPDTESDFVQARLEMPFGIAAKDTEAQTEAIIRAAQEVLDEKGGRGKVYYGVFAQTGDSGSFDGPMAQGAPGGSHLAEVIVFLVPLKERDFSSADFAKLWRQRIGRIAGAESLRFIYSEGVSGGDPVDLEISHNDLRVLETAAQDLAGSLEEYQGVSDISDGFQLGKKQLDFELTPTARAMGLTATDLARQVRASFFGAEALRQQRGRDEIRVYVRLPPEQRRSEHDIENLLIRTPSGGEIPLGQAAKVTRGRAYTSIKRTDSRRVLNVTADVDDTITTGTEVTAAVKKDVLPSLLERYPGLTYELSGEQRSQEETLEALGWGFVYALIGIFGLLAIAFRSYFQPVIIMSVIPFGMVGAIVGHVVMGYKLSLMSLMGIVALSGVVVNDSLILIVAINEYRAQGMSIFNAIIQGGVRRFRPIVLTSLTTFFGLVPMILETSAQARFMIPMAVSLGFGVLFATFIMLVLVPALYLIAMDFIALLKGEPPIEIHEKPVPADPDLVPGE